MNEKETQRYRFYSAVLKTIACTRNNAENDLNFNEGVLVPTETIRKMEISTNSDEVSEIESQQVYSFLLKIFMTKHTPTDERDYFLQYIEEKSGLSYSDESEE